MIWPGEALLRKGYDVTIHVAGSPESRLQALMTNTPSGPTVIGMEETPPYDVVVFQRPMARHLAESIPHLQAAGIAVVVELDDNFEELDPRNVAWPGVQPAKSPDSNYLWLRAAIRAADIVTVSTDHLRQVYAKWANVEPIVLRNYLPPHHGIGVTPPIPGTVGWSGGLNTHPRDLPIAATGIQQTVRDGTFSRFYVSGTGTGVERQLGTGVPLVASGGWVPIEEYPATLDPVSVGVVPLNPGPFNESKSWLKGLEFLGRGRTVVASHTSEYNCLASLSNGALVTAQSPKQWAKLLRARAADMDFSYWQALTAVKYLGIDSHAEMWMSAWVQARGERMAA